MNVIELKVAMVRKGIKTHELAKALNLCDATMYQKLRGKSNFTISEIRDISNYLGLSVDDRERIFFSD